MPIVDMPLHELKNYKGVSPKPADFDEYWDRAVKEMEDLGTGCTLTPAEYSFPGVELFHLTFKGVGGATVYGRYARPKNREGKCPALIRFHGYSGNRGDFAHLLNYVALGFCVAAMDARGQGGKSEDNLAVKGNTLNGHIIRGLDDPDPDKLYFRNVFLDTAQFARIIMAMEEVDETRVGATGGSQGGALTLACAALTPTLNRCCPMISFLCDYKRVWDMDLDVAAYHELRQYFRYFDPRHEREDEVFEKLGYIDNLNLAPRIKAKVKHFTGLMDTVCPPSTQFAAYNAINSEKEMVIYPDFAHEGFPDADDIIMEYMCEMLK